MMNARLARLLCTALPTWPLLTGCLGITPHGAAVGGWFVSDLRELTPETPPLLENEIYSAAQNQITLLAAINETLGFQAALHAPSSGQYQVTVSDLSGTAGKIPSAEAVHLFRILPTTVERFESWFSDSTGQPALPRSVPDILVPLDSPGGGVITLNAGHQELIWIDLHVPTGIGPGEYSGEFRLTGTGNEPVRWIVPIHLRVLAITLPPEPQLPAIARFDPRDLLSEQLKWPVTSAEETALLPGEAAHEPALRLVRSTMELLHAHRTTPVLWAGFPKYHLSGERSVEIDWAAYDQLVAGFLDGTAFADRVGLTTWPMPVSENYPSADRNGGFSSPRYARLLGAYVSECRKHFAQRGWEERAFVRICGPADLTQDSVERIRRAASILRQNEVTAPLAAHLPLQSLRAMGWLEAPPIEIPDVQTWIPPARWCDPQAARHEHGLGKHVWFMPDFAPYAGSLAVEAPPTDAALLGWTAYRYDLDGIWVENAAEFRTRTTTSDAVVQGAALIYPGKLAGLNDQVLPSVRLKRLRRGLQDYDLLRRLDTAGKPLLARRTAEQLVRWAFLDAATDNLLTTRASGLSNNPLALHLAQTLLRQELANEGGSAEQTTAQADWGRLMAENQALQPEVRGVRVASMAEDSRAIGYLRVSNATDAGLSVRCQMPEPPAGWRLTEEATLSAGPFGVGNGRLGIRMASLATNADGIANFPLIFDAGDGGRRQLTGRLAVTTCPFVDKARAPKLDGELNDWIMAAGNAAGDFRLVRGGRGGGDLPASATQVFFCSDPNNLYVAAVCAIEPGKSPQWRPSNLVTVDGNIPWGQELVEVLIDPHEPGNSSPGDLYLLQFKPSGLVLSHRGCPTLPPTSPVVEWQSGARVAIGNRPDAWLVEASIPLTALGASAAKTKCWGVNVTRFDAAHMEYSSWSGAKQNCYSPETLGNLIVVGP